MHIVIVGGGGVGYELARSLSEKSQDVVVIEKNELKARRFKEALDVMVIEDNGANAAVLEKADIKNAGMLIAVTQFDEINIIACMLAKKYGVPRTICRIRESGYADEDSVLTPKQLGIDLIINPERVAAFEISKMLHFPDITEVEYFGHGNVMMIGVMVGEEVGITDIPLHKLPMNAGCIIVGIKDAARGIFIVPGGDDVVKPGDKIYLVGNTRALKDISALLHHEKQMITQVTILGGGMIALHLARLLEESNHPFVVKLIEKDEERCEGLCRSLKKTLVIHGDATEIAMLKEEDIDWADAVIAATGDDRSNIVSALLARQFGVRKIICEVIKRQFFPVYRTLGIDSVINPRLIAEAQILRYIRREEVVTMSILKDENVEVFELILSGSARVANKKIVDVNFPRGMLIGSIVRGDEVIIPNGNSKLLPADHLVVIAFPNVSNKLDRFFAPTDEKETKGIFGPKLV